MNGPQVLDIELSEVREYESLEISYDFNVLTEFVILKKAF